VFVVANIRYSKIESKSQLVGQKEFDLDVVANIRYSKIESKSQLSRILLHKSSCCCKYKIFKDRKQITTKNLHERTLRRLLQI